MRDLNNLHGASASGSGLAVILPEEAKRVTSPLRARLDQWRESLRRHPDEEFGRYILQGIEEGFKVGFNHGACRQNLQPAKRNMPSALAHTSIVDSYLEEELALGRIVGPFVRDQFQVQVSRFGVIPKSTPGKWRLITDLSFPPGHSVNDGVDVVCAILQWRS